jgi:hypothetical protein
MSGTSIGWTKRHHATVHDYVQSRIKVDELSGCWLWGNGALNSYGWFQYKYETGGAHQKVFELYKGEIPEGKIIRHKCDTPKCVNPDHLEIGTKKDNRRDFMERHPRAKELVSIGQKAGTEGVKRFWARMTPEQRKEFCKQRSEKQMAKYPNWSPSRGGKQVPL